MAKKIVFSAIIILVILGYIFSPIFLKDEFIKRFDATVVGLLFFATLPWLASFVAEIEAFGVKAKLREAIQTAEDAKAKALEAQDAASDTIEQTEMLRFDTSAVEATLAKSDLETIARKYVSTRNAMSSGRERTAKMTELFSAMQRAAIKEGSGHIDAKEWLKDKDAGKQLAAIAYFRAFLDEVDPTELIDVIERHGQQPFVQYWALRVLNNVVDNSGADRFTGRDLGQIRDLETKFRNGTDRQQLSAKVNRKLERIMRV